MSLLLPAVALCGFVFSIGILGGAFVGYRDARYDRARMQRLVHERRQRQQDVLRAVRELINAGDTSAACDLIDAELVQP